MGDEMTDTHICDCGHDSTPYADKFVTGYGTSPEGKTYCFPCCGERDKAAMLETGKGTLYLDTNKWTVGNWPGTLSFRCHHYTIGRHNIARKCYHCWFTGPDGAVWHGVTYGDDTQICHVKRTKLAR